MAKAKRKELNLSEKIELINSSEGRSQRELARAFDIGKTQVQSILKRKSEWLEAYEGNMDVERKRFCSSQQFQQKVDALTYAWFKKARSHLLPVSGPIIQERALMFASAIGLVGFKASNGWLNRFKKRHGLAIICGGGSSVDKNVVTDWMLKFSQILDGYEAKDIFNVAETGLFFRALPDKTFKLKGEEFKKGENSEERMTVSFCVNIVGTFEKTVVIGRCAKPRCFKHLDLTSLPVVWEHNKKAWMTSEIFSRWLRNFNNRMKQAHRHVILLLDNAPCHSKDIQLSNVKMIFLPANTTSHLQPLDQGIIKAIKVRYRKRLLQTVLLKMEEGENTSDISKGVSVLDAINWLSSVVKDISSTTVQKCFKKAGIQVTDSSDCLDYESDEEIPLINLIYRVQEHLETTGESIDDYIAGDDSTPTCNLESRNLEEQVLEEFHEDQIAGCINVDSDDGANDLPCSLTPTKITGFSSALNCVGQLKSFVLEKNAGHLVELVYELEKGLCDLSARSTKQHLDS